MRKLKALIAWCKSLRSIVRTYRGDNDRIHQRIAELEKIIRERTGIAVDAYSNPRYGTNHVIVVGRYGNRDYVRAYSMPSGEFAHLIDRLKQESRYGRITTVDAVPEMREVIITEAGRE